MYWTQAWASQLQVCSLCCYLSMCWMPCILPVMTLRIVVKSAHLAHLHQPTSDCIPSEQDNYVSVCLHACKFICMSYVAQAPRMKFDLQLSLLSVWADVPISLHRQCDGSSGVWDCIASGTTNSDGRVGDLLPASDSIAPGMYK